MKNKTEVINILKGTHAFFALVFAKKLYVIAKFSIICFIHTLFTVRILSKNIKYCGYDTALKRQVFI